MAYAPSSAQIVAQTNAKFLQGQGTIGWWGLGAAPAYLDDGRCWTWHDWCFYVGNRGLASQSDYLRLPDWGAVSAWKSAAVAIGFDHVSGGSFYADIYWVKNGLVDVQKWFVTRTGGAGTATFEITDISGESVHWQNTQLLEDTTYTYSIKPFKERIRGGFNERYYGKAFSCSFKTKLNNVENLAAYLTGTSQTTINVEWDWGGTAMSGYRVERSTNGGAGPWSVRKDSTTWVTGHDTFSEVGVAGTTYTYRIVVYKKDTSGNIVNESSTDLGTYPTTSVMVPQPQTQPTSASAIESLGDIRVGWNGNLDSTWRFRVEKRVNGGPYAFLAFDTSSPYIDSAVSSGNTYQYQVRSEKTDGTSPQPWLATNTVTL